MQCRTPCLLAQFLGFKVQKLGRVGLAQEEEAKDLYHPVCSRGRIKRPSPGRVLHYKTACKRPNGRTQEWGKAVDGNSTATLINTSTVRKDTTAQGEWSRPT